METIRQKDNPTALEQGIRFGKGMVGWTITVDSNAVTTGKCQVIRFRKLFWNLVGFPWDKLRHGAIVNDVGGNLGYISMELCKRYPHLNLRLQDLPEQTEYARKVIWPKEYPQAIADGRIEFKSVDLFVESPIPNCDVYLVSVSPPGC